LIRLRFRPFTVPLLALLIAVAPPAPKGQEAPEPVQSEPAQPDATEPEPAPELPEPPEAALDNGAVLRLGVVHPHPRLCRGQEPAQRDLRVLRLAYGLAHGPERRLALPWFYAPLPGTPPEEPRLIGLRPGALWSPADIEAAQRPPAPAPGGTVTTATGTASSTASSTASGAKGLAADLPARSADAWPAGLLRQISLLRPAPDGVWGHFRVTDPGQDPFLFTRLAQSGLLPEPADEAVAGPAFCRTWPAGVEFRPGRGAVSYTLLRAQDAGGRAFTLVAYRGAGALWANFAAGRMDALLLESSEITAADPKLTSGGVWGVESGTQQIILRWHPRLARELTAEARAVLSQSLNRADLAHAGARGGFRPVRAFLEPLLPPARLPAADAFVWDSLTARQRWLGQPRPERRLKIAVLVHPLLEPLAQQIAGQWQKSLELQVSTHPLEADRIWSDWAGDTYDLMLDVVDLDDGSLQDLWNAALPGLPPLPQPKTRKAAQPKGGQNDLETLLEWEQRLRLGWPYLPLVTNTQWVFAARGHANQITQACPGCAITTQGP
jgi:hypothetical protein